MLSWNSGCVFNNLYGWNLTINRVTNLMFESISSRITTLIVTLLISVSLSSCDALFGVDEEQAMADAKQYVAEKKLNAAVVELKNLLQSNPANAEARYLLSRLSLQLGDLESAEKEIRRAIEAGWDEGLSTAHRAEILLRMGNFEELLAEAFATDAYTAEVRADIYGLRAAAHISEQRNSAALTELERGEQIEAGSSWILHSRVRMLMLDEAWDQALARLAEAREMHPENQDFLLLEATIHERKGDREAVIAALQKALELDPPKIMTVRGRNAALSLVQNLISTGDTEQAATVLKKVLRNFSRDPVANYYGGLLAYEREEFDTVIEHITRVLAAVSDHRESLLLLGNTYFRTGDFEQAAYHLERATVVAPDNMSAQALLGQTYMAMGEYSSADERLTLVSRKVKDDPGISALIGISRMRGGDSRSGITELERANDMNPGNDSIREELARAYIMSGEADRAINKLKEDTRLETSAGNRSKALLLLANLQTGDYETAMQQARELSEELPELALPHNLLGTAHEAGGNFVAARESYERAKSLDDTDSLSTLNLARLDLVEGKVESAEQRFSSLLETYPDNPSAQIGLARIDLIRGDASSAISRLQRVTKTDESNVESRTMLATVFIRGRDPARAIEYADEAYRLNQRDVQILAVRTAAYVNAEHERAGDVMQEMLESAPDLPFSHYYHARYKLSQGDRAGSRVALEKALKLEPEYHDALLAMANMERLDGDLDGALSYAYLLQEKHPQRTSGYLLEANVQLEKREAEAALAVLKKAEPLAVTGDVAIKLNEVYQSLGDQQAGIAVLEDWIEKNPEDLQARFSLAVSLMVMPDYPAAIEAYEAILDIQPNLPVVMNDLAWLYNETGRTGGVEMARRAHQMVPENAAIQDTYGWLLIQTGRIENGLVMLEAAARKAPQQRDIQFHYAYALDKDGQKDKAREILDRILADGRPFTERKQAQQLAASLK